LAWSPDLGAQFAVESEILDVLEEALPVFADAGAVIEAATPNVTGADEVFRTLRAWQFQLTHANLIRQQAISSRRAWPTTSPRARL